MAAVYTTGPLRLVTYRDERLVCKLANNVKIWSDVGAFEDATGTSDRIRYVQRLDRHWVGVEIDDARGLPWKELAVLAGYDVGNLYLSCPLLITRVSGSEILLLCIVDQALEPEDEPFVGIINSSLDDYTSRLVYADYLEELGRREEAYTQRYLAKCYKSVANYKG